MFGRVRILISSAVIQFHNFIYIVMLIHMLIALIVDFQFGWAENWIMYTNIKSIRI